MHLIHFLWCTGFGAGHGSHLTQFLMSFNCRSSEDRNGKKKPTHMASKTLALQTKERENYLIRTSLAPCWQLMLRSTKDHCCEWCSISHCPHTAVVLFCYIYFLSCKKNRSAETEFSHANRFWLVLHSGRNIDLPWFQSTWLVLKIIDLPWKVSRHLIGSHDCWSPMGLISHGNNAKIIQESQIQLETEAKLLSVWGMGENHSPRV